MKATFELDPCHTLVIASIGVHHASEAGNGVVVRLLYQPLGLEAHPDNIAKSEPWDRAMHLPPSFARAIASALLSAATEARAA